MTKPKPRLRRKQADTEVIAFRATPEEIQAVLAVARELHPEKAITKHLAFRELALSRGDVRECATTIHWTKGAPK